VQDNRLRYAYNYVAQKYFQVVSDVKVPSGNRILGFEFEPPGQPEPLKGKGAPGIAKLFIDGKLVGQGELPVTIPLLLGLAAGVSVGQDAGAPVAGPRPPLRRAQCVSEFSSSKTRSSCTADRCGS
jgi:hypothetical protein